jgi:hypothetical protein
MNATEPYVVIGNYEKTLFLKNVEFNGDTIGDIVLTTNVGRARKFSVKAQENKYNPFAIRNRLFLINGLCMSYVYEVTEDIKVSYSLSNIYENADELVSIYQSPMATLPPY